ncbi:hypothetical protein BMS3Abin02_00019 [bacterium BMS3Abin02]|nr:hypothetical protein BMS3Abin02_00019 [bacterium BMS3Abin02]GBE23130.1 hypothetical protein BMS3Bbin01_02513 [bacterium BMS3Bbin01]HDH25383.1 hypothetical protein [Actinomycetota bacterium]HDK45989.1 hypothetical protein [Actinomycetota bacterium]HDL48764.1 hypothetical protein [Actinomycetota bacterium]
MPDGDNTDQPADQTPGPVPNSSASSRIAKLGAGERWLALGAAIVLADYVLFDLILGEYFFFTGTLLVAGFVLFAVWVHQDRPSASWPLPYEWLLRVLGFTAGFLGVLELLADLRFNVLDLPFDVFGGLFVYIGAFLMFWGARELKGSGGS